MTAQLRSVVEPVTRHIAGRPLDAALEAELNRAFPAGSETFRAIERECHDGIAAGVLCTHGGGNLRFGRVFEPGRRWRDSASTSSTSPSSSATTTVTRPARST
jgi:hypothetical protein